MKIKLTNNIYNAKTTRAIEKRFNDLFCEGMTEKELAKAFACDNIITAPRYDLDQFNKLSSIDEEHDLSDLENIFVIKAELNSDYIAIDFLGRGWGRDRHVEFCQVYNLTVYDSGLEPDITFGGYCCWEEFKRI